MARLATQTDSNTSIDAINLVSRTPGLLCLDLANEEKIGFKRFVCVIQVPIVLK